MADLRRSRTDQEHFSSRHIPHIRKHFTPLARQCYSGLSRAGLVLMAENATPQHGGPEPPPPPIPAELFEQFYGELRILARRYMAGERRNHTLQPTALVHEAFLRLAAAEPILVNNRVHFLRLVAQNMRRILIDYGRQRAAKKNGGGMLRISFSDISAAMEISFDAVALDEALDQLETESQRQAAIIQLRYIVGLTVGEVADLLEISESTVKGEVRVAMAWLRRRLSP